MIRPTLVGMLAPLLLAASAPVAPQTEPLDAALQRARAEQSSAAAEARRLEAVADRAQGEAERLRAREAAAAQGIEAAEARITAADAQLAILSSLIAVRRGRLQREQQPVASLLAGLAMMARRPPLLALADDRSTDEFVKVRLLLDSTLPAIRRRTAGLAAEIAEGQRLERAALAARQELVSSRAELVTRKQQFAALEQQSLHSSVLAGGKALSAGDVALAAGEDIERLAGAQAGSRAARALAIQLETLDAAPARPIPSPGAPPAAPFAYRLPAAAAVTEGLGSVNASGVRSRGLTLATLRGAALAVPAAGIVRFSGPFRNHDGIVIIDHGGGWMSLIVNAASPLKVGERVALGDPLGRALGPIGLELSQNGIRVSPALIAGSSQPLSNGPKRG